MRLNANDLRRWSRNIHRELSFFFAGVLLIYVVSGFVMNHRDTINPHYSVKRIEYSTPYRMPAQEDITRNDVTKLLEAIGEENNYTKHYFPQPGEMKVFLKGGSNLWVELATGHAVYESVKRRPVIGGMTRLHYNPGKWWTIFSDIFALGMVVITVTGVVMLKGKKGIIGRGGIELLAGMAIPIVFLLFF